MMNKKNNYFSYGSVDYGVSCPQIPSPLSSESRWTYKDVIILDPDDQRLDAVEDSSSPLTFDLLPDMKRNAVLLENLQSEIFRQEHSLELMEKFNNLTNAEGSDITRGSVTSSSSSTPRRTSLSGSSFRGSVTKVTERERRPITSRVTNVNASNDLIRRGSLDEETKTLMKSAGFAKATRSNTMLLKERPVALRVPPSGMKGNMQSGGVRNTRQKKTNPVERKESLSESARKMFVSLRKHGKSSPRERKGNKGSPDNSNIGGSSGTTTKSELSSDANLPGILKIFGDAVSPGANYKSVMATTSSNAKELVKMALERYGVPKYQAKYHVLCEVVGKLSEKKILETETESEEEVKNKAKNHKQNSGIHGLNVTGAISDGKQFIEEYVRPLNDYEKPLVLQSYWKPLVGYCRRFEIRRRSKIFKKEKKDHMTRDVNAQARRLLMQKSRSNLRLPFFINEPQTESDDSENEKMTSFELKKLSHGACKEMINRRSTDNGKRSCSSPQHVDISACKNGHSEIGQLLGLPKISPKESEDRVTPDGDTCNSPSKNEFMKKAAPSDSLPCPYLITLQGNEDTLIHSIKNDEVLIGSDVSEFKLSAPDILRHHCVINRRMDVTFAGKGGRELVKHWSVDIEPLQKGADIRVNGVIVTSKHNLQHGEIIAIGKQHIFMYKDPLSHVSINNVAAFSFANLSSKDSDDSSTQTQGLQTNSQNYNIPSSTSPPVPLTTIETEVNYVHGNEDVILDEIFNCITNINDIDEDLSLAPAVLLCHCIIHSCLNFELQHKQDTLMKIASNLQTLILDAARCVSHVEVEISSELTPDVHHLLTSLRPVAFWMSNCMEVFQFLQKDLPKVIQKRVHEEMEKGLLDPKILDSASSFAVSEEILGLLEESVMHSFQQLVYYLTKVLYIALPAILQCNPFAPDLDADLRVAYVTDVYACARDMTQCYAVNSRIREQLFTYLFFFTNVSLINCLMDEDASTKYYKWEMGVRIRGNLEIIETWAVDNGYLDQCSKFMEKVFTLANLLATPKGQIMKSTWLSFRENFPSLSPAQLNKILSYYFVPGMQTKPKIWNPDLHERKEASDKSCILESYENHPPLTLPLSNSNLNLSPPSSQQGLRNLYQRIKEVAMTSSNDVIRNQRRNMVREQPDGGEHSNYDIVDASPPRRNPAAQTSKEEGQKRAAIEDGDKNTSALSFSNSAFLLYEKEKENNSTATKPTLPYGLDRNVSLSAGTAFSELDICVAMQKRNSGQKYPIDDITEKSSDLKDLCVTLEYKDDYKDEAIVLPISETVSRLSIKKNQKSSHRPHSDDNTATKPLQDGPPYAGMKVFHVIIQMDGSGLGVGLVDGKVTGLGICGVFVRSLVPDNPNIKRSHSKHHDMLRCWLQRGRLQLGDQLLEANGVSLVNLTFQQAMRKIRGAGESVNLVVGRGGADAAFDVTSSVF